MSCWRRIRISATSFVLGLKSEAMIWRISRSNSIIKWQGYRVSASRLAESNFRYAQGDLSLNVDVPLWDQCFAQLEPLQAAHDLQSEMPAMYGSLIKCRGPLRRGWDSAWSRPRGYRHAPSRPRRKL